MRRKLSLLAAAFVIVAGNVVFVSTLSAAPLSCSGSCKVESDCDGGGSACVCFANPFGPHCWSVSEE